MSVIYSLIFRFFKKLILPCPFNNLGCLISSTTELHVSLIYTWIWSPYEICDLQLFFSFHRWPLYFIDDFFYYAEDFEFDAVSVFIVSALAFAFDDWFVWATCILECNPLPVVLFAIIFSHSYQKTQTGWMDTKTIPIYMLSTRGPLQS